MITSIGQQLVLHHNHFIKILIVDGIVIVIKKLINIQPVVQQMKLIQTS